jgi:hypothetical protein
MNRFSRRRARASTPHLALLVSLLAAGCGEAKTTIEPEEVINGLDGTLHARIASFEDGHAEMHYRLVRPDGENIPLDFGDAMPSVQPGARIAVRGPRGLQELRVEGFDVLRKRIDDRELAQPLRSGAPKTLKIAMLNVSTTANATLETRTKTAVDSPTAFFRDNSYGDWTVEIDVYGPYSYTVSDCSDTNITKTATEIRQKATDAGVDLSKYDNFMYYLKQTSSCGWSGLAEVGVNAARGFKNGIDSWYNNSNGCVVLAQELTHNYGLLHSHSCSGPPYASTQWGSSSCPSYNEYGDGYTPMGGGCGHFNAPEMAEMGYISGCNMLAVTSSGTFEIGPIETRCAGPQVLQVPGAANVNQGQQYIYVEYRKGKGTVGSDNKSPQGLYFHASAEPGGLPAPMPPDPDLPYVVDPFYIHAPLTSANASWTESTSGATFTLVSVGNTATVQVSLPGGGDGGAVKCVDGTTPPTSPMCGVSPDAGGTGGTGGTGGKDASTDVGTGGAAGSAGSGGAAGSGGSAGTAGSGTTDAGRDTGAGGAGTGGSSGTAGTGGSAGSAGKGGSSGTGGAAGSGGGGTSGSGGSAGSATGGSAGSGGGSSGASGSTGTAGKGGSGATGGSSSGSGGSGTADDGCSCSVPGGRRSNTAPWMMLGLAALIPALRRRSRR